MFYDYADASYLACFVCGYFRMLKQQEIASTTMHIEPLHCLHMQ